MAAIIKDKLDVQVTLIPEGRGIFDVVVDGRLIYSKYTTSSFPDAGQLIQEIGSI
ncbi:MAG: Rdx family protein [Gammaproteobacteria bacterium]|nr:Rdx family protein [Gammaproteobacteria bacterium]